MKIVIGLLLGCGLFAQTPPPYNLQISQQPLPVVSTVFANYTGSQGQLTYYYYVIARYGVGNAGLSPVSTVTRIDPSGSVGIGWSAPASPSNYSLTYDVLRLTSIQFPSSGSCTNCLVASATGLLSTTDTLGNLSNYTLMPYVTNTANITLDNQSTDLVKLIETINNVTTELGLTFGSTLPTYCTSGDHFTVTGYLGGNYACVQQNTWVSLPCANSNSLIGNIPLAISNNGSACAWEHYQNKDYAFPMSNGGAITGNNVKPTNLLSVIDAPSSGTSRYPALSIHPLTGNLVSTYWHGTGFETADGFYRTKLSNGGESWVTINNNIKFPTGLVPYDNEMATLSNGLILGTFLFSDVAQTNYSCWAGLATPQVNGTYNFGGLVQVTGLPFSQCGTSGRAIPLDDGTILWPIYGSNQSGLNGPWVTGVVISSLANPLNFSSYSQVTASGTYSECNGWQNSTFNKLNPLQVIMICRGDATTGYSKITSNTRGLTWGATTIVIPATAGKLLGKPSPIQLGNDDIALFAGWESSSRQMDYWKSSTHGDSWTAALIWKYNNYSGGAYQSVVSLSGCDIGVATSGDNGSHIGVEFTEFNACNGTTLAGSASYSGLVDSPTIETFIAGTGGTTINTLVQLDTSTPSNVIPTTTAVYGIAQATQLATFPVQIATKGTVNCVTDTGGATAGHIAVIGTGTVIDCKDSGQTSISLVSNSLSIVGTFLTTATAGNLALIELGSSIGSTGTLSSVVTGVSTFHGTCNGAVLSNGTNAVSIENLGASEASGNCNNAAIARYGTVATASCTLKNLYIQSSTGGAGASDGIFTVQDSLVNLTTGAVTTTPTGLTCTVGTNFSCSDTNAAHNYSLAAGHLVWVIGTTTSTNLSTLSAAIGCN